MTVLTEEPRPGEHSAHSGEDLRVFRWRCEELERVGADPHSAELLADRFDLDLHDLRKLIAAAGISYTLKIRL